MNIFTYVNPWLDAGFAGGLPLTVFKGGGFGLSSNPKGQCWLRTLEARVGFEPTNGGFADLSLRPLGYRAETTKYSETGRLFVEPSPCSSRSKGGRQFFQG